MAVDDVAALGDLVGMDALDIVGVMEAVDSDVEAVMDGVVEALKPVDGVVEAIWELAVDGVVEAVVDGVIETVDDGVIETVDDAL